MEEKKEEKEGKQQIKTKVKKRAIRTNILKLLVVILIDNVNFSIE